MPSSPLCPPSDLVVLLLVHSSGRTRGDWLPVLPALCSIAPHHPPGAKLRRALASARLCPALWQGREKVIIAMGERAAAVAFPAS